MPIRDKLELIGKRAHAIGQGISTPPKYISGKDEHGRLWVKENPDYWTIK